MKKLLVKFFGEKDDSFYVFLDAIGSVILFITVVLIMAFTLLSFAYGDEVDPDDPQGYVEIAELWPERVEQLEDCMSYALDVALHNYPKVGSIRTMSMLTVFSDACMTQYIDPTMSHEEIIAWLTEEYGALTKFGWRF